MFGEVGLAGEVRATAQAARRLREAARMGFTRCIVPAANADAADPDVAAAGCEAIGVRSIQEALDQLLVVS